MTLRQSECILYLVVTAISCTPESNAPDITPPIVISVIPDSGATNVSLSIKPSVIFSEPLDPEYSYPHFDIVTQVGGRTGPISGQIRYSADTLIFTPDVKLLPNQLYLASVNRVMDMSGNMMDSFFYWKFTTEPSSDVTPPMVISVFPLPDSKDVSRDSKITVVFSEKVREGTVSSNSFTVKRRGLTIAGQILGKISCKDSIAVFVPNYILEPKAFYDAVIRPDVMDIAGNNLSKGYGWSFYTAESP